MDRYEELIKEGRAFTKGEDESAGYQTDQQKEVKQPPLFKEKMCAEQIALPTNFEDLKLENDILNVFKNRVSRRVFKEEALSLLELSFVLWATQGVKSIKGDNYCTLRIVPSSGARHPFETYLTIRDVEGLKPGAYHYVAETHELEYLHEVEDMNTVVNDALVGQAWCTKANAVFYWAAVAYRSEWRYGLHAHRGIVLDAGHVGQNMYVACEAAGLGTCALSSLDGVKCSNIFKLDGEDEFVIYAAPLGRAC